MIQQAYLKQDPDEIDRTNLLFSFLPSQWRVAKLGEIAKVLYGKARPRNDGSFPVIGSGGIFGSTSTPLVEYETLIIGRKGSAGSVYYSPHPSYPSDTAFYLQWKQEVHVLFLYYSLLFKGLVPDKSVIPSLQRNDIENFNILFPPLPEQRAIADILQAVQEAIRARHQEIELEREGKAALMQYLFTLSINGEATKQCELGKIPASWQVVKLGDVCESSAFGPRFSSDFYGPDGNIATLRTTDIDDEGNIDYSTMPLAKLDMSRFMNHLLKSRDFLVTRSGTCGIAAVFDSFEKPVLPGAFLIRFRLAQELNPYFLQYYINSPIGRIRVSQLAGGAAQQNLTGTALRNLEIPFPSIEEQSEIVQILRACDTKLATLKHELKLLVELFQTLLDELMTGRISTASLFEEGRAL